MFESHMSLISLVCKQCGAELEYDIHKPCVRCSHCGTVTYYDCVESQELINAQREIDKLKKRLESAKAANDFEMQIFCITMLAKMEPENVDYAFYLQLWRVLLGKDMLTPQLAQGLTAERMPYVQKLLAALAQKPCVYGRPVCLLALSRYVQKMSEAMEPEENPDGSEYHSCRDIVNANGSIACMASHRKRFTLRFVWTLTLSITALLFVINTALLGSLIYALMWALISGFIAFLGLLYIRQSGQASTLLICGVETPSKARGRLYLYQDGVVLENSIGMIWYPKASFPLDSIRRVVLIDGETLQFCMCSSGKDTTFRITNDDILGILPKLGINNDNGAVVLKNYINGRLQARKGQQRDG